MNFTLRADRSLIRSSARSRRHLLVELRAPEAAPREGRLPVHIAFVIDRSGSMHGAKIAHAQSAVVQGIRSLREGDRFAVVTYDDAVDVVVAGVEASAAAREAAVAAVERIGPGGSTDLHGGWSAGCEQAVEVLPSEAVARCLLLTDGLANHGVMDHGEIVRQCAGWRDRRVGTSTFGVGEDFDEDNDRQPRDRTVDRPVAALYAARAVREALGLNRKGDHRGARKAIEACAARIRGYAAEDPELLKLIADLGRRARMLERDMGSFSSKRLYSFSNAAMSGKASRVRANVNVEDLLARVIDRLAAANPDLLRGLDVDGLPGRLAHAEARGCLLDPTKDPAGDLELRLRAADPCPQCRAALEAQGVPADRLQQIVEALRLLGAPSGVVH